MASQHPAPAGSNPCYTSMKQASSAMNIPLRFVKKAKGLAAPGFTDNRLYPDKFLPWWNEHKAELETDDTPEITLESIKKENLLKDGVLKDLEIRKRKKDFLDPVEVKTLLQTIATSQAAILKRIPAEYPQRLAGRSAPDIEIELTKMVTDIIGIFRSGLANWK